MENPIKMDDLGVPLFSETPKYTYMTHWHPLESHCIVPTSSETRNSGWYPPKQDSTPMTCWSQYSLWQDHGEAKHPLKIGSCWSQILYFLWWNSSEVIPGFRLQDWLRLGLLILQLRHLTKLKWLVAKSYQLWHKMLYDKICTWLLVSLQKLQEKPAAMYLT